MPTPMYLQTKGYTAKQDRQVAEALAHGAVGILNVGDFKVSTTAGLGVSVAAGQAIVRGTTNSDQGCYVARYDSATPLTHTAVSANPRVDSIYLTVRDSTEAGGVSDDFTIQIVAGTETVGATLDNRTGAGAAPASSILLADVLVQTGPTITIRDRRPYAADGVLPAIKTTGADAVAVQPLGFAATGTLGVNQDLLQGACAVRIPTKITASKIRWGYTQNTAATGTYNIGIYDASGRQIVTTGALSLTGGNATHQSRSESITSTTFYPGIYYVWFGFDITNSGSANYAAMFGAQGSSVAVGPNLHLYAGSGGTTAPTTLLGLTDLHSSVPGGAFLGAPVITLATA